MPQNKFVNKLIFNNVVHTESIILHHGATKDNIKMTLSSPFPQQVVHTGSVLLHLGATKEHLEAGAEEMSLSKRRLDSGEMRPFDRDVKGKIVFFLSS